MKVVVNNDAKTINEALGITEERKNEIVGVLDSAMNKANESHKRSAAFQEILEGVETPQEEALAFYLLGRHESNPFEAMLAGAIPGGDEEETD